jgi:adenosylcobinamide-GDP ribazoletransferase
MIEATTRLEAGWAALGCVVIGLITAGARGGIAAGVALALGWSLTKLARTRLGGVTGDTLGAVLEMGELGFLMTLVLTTSTRT